MNAFEAGLYDLASLFLMPVLVLIVAALGYSFFALGGFAWKRCSGYAVPGLPGWQFIAPRTAAPRMTWSCGS